MDGSSPAEGFHANLIAIFQTICRNACETIHVDHSGFVQFNYSRTAGTVVAEYPQLPAGPLIGREVKLQGIRAEEQLLSTDEPLVRDDVENATDLGEVRNLLLEYDIRSICVVKVRFHGVEIGSFSFDSVGKKRRFTSEDRIACQEFADLASKTIQAKQNAYRLESFSKGTVAITSEDRPEYLLDTIVKQAQSLFGAESVGLYKRESDHEGEDSLVLAASSQPGLVGKRLAKPEGMAWQVILTEVSYIQTQNYDSYEYKSKNFEEGQFGAVLEVPLVRHSERIGVIYLADPPGQMFSVLEASLLQRFADVATVAIQHAALVERMKALSIASADISSAFTSQSREQTLCKIATHTAQILNAEACDVFRVEDDKLVLEASDGREDGDEWPRTLPIQDKPMAASAGVIAARLISRFQVSSGNPVDDEWLIYNDADLAVARDHAADSASSATAGGCEHSSIAALLVTHTPDGRKVSGLLHVRNKRAVDGRASDSVHFNAEDQRVLRILADAVVVGMEGARLFESLQRQKDLANALAGDAPLDDRLRKVAMCVVTITDRSFCRVLLADESEEYLTVRAAALHPEVADAITWNPAGLQRTPVSAWPHLQQALAAGVPYELNAKNDEQRDILWRLSTLFDIREHGEPVSIGALFGVPMTIGQRTAGLLSVGHLEHDGEAYPFSDEQKHFIAAIAAQATITIDREWRPLEIERAAKKREETLKYLAMHYIKCGVVFQNHHNTALTLDQWAEALEEDAIQEDVSETLLNDIRWLRRSVKSLLKVIVAAPLSFEAPPVRELNVLIMEWVEGLRAEKLWKEIDFRPHLEKTKDVVIRLDADLLGEAFLVFAKNSRKEMLEMPEGRERSLSIFTSIDSFSRIMISFTDSGRGISPEKLERIRTNLRAGMTEQRERGLGLVTAQLILTRFGGEVLEPQSTDQGATFTIVLPQHLDLDRA